MILNQLPEIFVNKEDSFEEEVLSGVYVRGEGPLWIGEDVELWEGCTIERPAFIGAGTVVRSGALIRSGCWIGKRCVIGHCAEISRSVFFDEAECRHQAIILDSVIGYKVTIAGGTGMTNFLLSSLRSGTEKTIKVASQDRSNILDTNRSRFGCILGDKVVTSGGTMMFPGTCVGKESTIYPREGKALSGIWPPNSIIKQ